MQSTRIFTTSRIVCRFISLSSASDKNYAGRESRFLSKLINKSEPKRKWYKDGPNSYINNCGLDIQKKRLTSLHVQRRVTVLNKLFMKHITDLISTGETAQEMIENRIEVTRVTLSPDFKIANVFWTNEKVNDENWLLMTEEMLKRCAFTLRHELSQLRVISHVPPIHFVKDKICAAAKKVEERLAIADFGIDYKQPAFTLEETVQICLPSDIDETTSKSDVNCDKTLETNDFQIVLPQMRHDVLGLDHYSIMSKIKSSLNKSKYKNKDSTTYPRSTSSIHNNIDNFTEEKQKELFTQFLKKRQAQEKHRWQMKYSKVERNPMYTNEETLDCKEYIIWISQLTILLKSIFIKTYLSYQFHLHKYFHSD